MWCSFALLFHGWQIVLGSVALGMVNPFYGEYHGEDLFSSWIAVGD
jgi:hypothetical protein